uniref:Uncharacterized protein n=1 Tax=Myripristis murdjan TaxID=586833 RepID=A0A668AFH9_9TELE
MFSCHACSLIFQQTYQDGDPVVVETGSCTLKGFHSPREEKESKDSWCEEICHLVQDSYPVREEEGISERTKVQQPTHHNVGISVEELDEFLQTPEANEIQRRTEIFELSKTKTSSKRQSSCVIPNTERDNGCREDWEGWHVIRLDKGPVVGGKSPCQGHLSQSRDKIGTPEEEEDVVELQTDQVLVVNSFSTVEGCEVLNTDIDYIEIEQRVEKGRHHMPNGSINKTITGVVTHS